MNQSINLNLIPDGVKPVAKVSQFDVGRVVTFSLYQGPDVYTPPAGTTLEFRELKSDKHICVYDDAATLSGSTITLETTQQMTASAGEALCQFKLTNGTDVLATLNFWLDVQVDPAAEGDISDSDVPAIIELATEQMERAEAAADSAAADAESAADSKEDAETAATSADASATAAEDSAEDAEAYAIGTRGGTDVPSTDPAYQNNSKYYSDLASAWAAHPPYVGANGDWYVYDPITQQFVDTGIDASITMQIQDVTMLSYGSTPTVTNTGTSTDAVFHLGIPRAATIASVQKTSTSGLVDTYTMTLQDGTTFTYTVTNGADGQGSVSSVNNIQPVGGNVTLGLGDLNGVDLSTLSDGDVLVYDLAAGKWINGGAVGGGHTIENPSGTAMAQRSNLQFKGNGVTVTDDSVNNTTVVEITGGGTTIVQKPTVTVGTYTYNGAAQGPTITWATGMEDNCVVTNATKTDAGTYTLTIALKNTAKMVWADMTTADMTYEYSIAKADQTLTLSSNSVTLDPDHLTASVTVTGAETTLSATSSDSTVATASISGSTVTVSNVNENNGSATITLTTEATNNYNSATATISVTAQFTTFLDEWLTAADLNPALYADLNAVFADEKAVRKLFTIHDAVDYLVTNASDSNVATIINNDYCAKWINLRDYALDTLYANATIAALMDTADKYFYGEWTIVDSTTTPPTWGAKGNVPVMTSNTAPYGEASASSVYSTNIASKAFDGATPTSSIRSFWHSNFNDAGTWSNQWLAYKFTNPVCIKRYWMIGQPDSSNVLSFSGKLQGSNDGSTWVDIENEVTYDKNNFNSSAGITIDVDNTNYYLWYRVYFTSGNVGGNASKVFIGELQFYGRELRVSVPTMTSDTAPYGEASAGGVYNDYMPYKAFDNNQSTSWVSDLSEIASKWWLLYKFTNKMCVRRIAFQTSQYPRIVSFSLLGSNDGINFTPIYQQQGLTPSTDLFTFDFLNNFGYQYLKFDLTDEDNNRPFVSYLQFYGLDYSEYDWDEDNPRHYIYDHGVELETLESVGNNANNYAEKRPNEIYVHKTGSASGAAIISSTSINLADYAIMRAASGDQMSMNMTLSARPSKTYDDRSDTANVNIDPGSGNLPYNMSLDISSISQTLYVAYGKYQNSTAEEHYGTITEWWLE